MNKKRTTLVLPGDVYRRTKEIASHQGKSVSRFVSELLAKETGLTEENRSGLPWGKYRLKAGQSLRRPDIYENHLGRKVSD